MSQEPTLGQQIAAFGGAFSVIFALVGVIYHNIKKTQETQQDQLDDGVDAFTANAVAISELKSELKSVREWMKAAERKMKEIETGQDLDHDKLNKLNTKHHLHHKEDHDN
jgi:uncharacterized membrane protein YdfJ with MMPL/SSD domain